MKSQVFQLFMENGKYSPVFYQCLTSCFVSVNDNSQEYTRRILVSFLVSSMFAPI